MKVDIYSDRVRFENKGRIVVIPGINLLKADAKPTVPPNQQGPVRYNVIITIAGGQTYEFNPSEVENQRLWANGQAGAEAAIADIMAIAGKTIIPGVGITELTGPVTAGPGSGPQATTITPTGVTPGSYTNANITVDPDGRISAADNGAGGGVTSVGASAPISSSGGATPNISHNASGVTPATYTNATVTVDSTGHVTSASNGSTPGNVFKVGTPANNQVGVWTGDGTIEGDTKLTWDGSTLGITGGANISGLTASQAVVTDGSKNLASRPIGASSATDIIDRQSGDARYALLSHPSFLNYTGGTIATTSTSLSDIDSSAGWTGVTPGLYRLQAVFGYSAAATTTGALFSLGGTTGYSYMAGVVQYTVQAGDKSTSQFNTFNGGVAVPSSFSSGNITVMDVMINVTGTGDLVLRFATEISGSAITLNGLKGFLMRLY